MTKAEAYSALIKLAHEMVMGEALPSPFYEDHKFYTSTPMAERRQMVKQFEKINDLAKDWAMRIKAAADAMNARSMEVDTKKAAVIARETAIRKTALAYPYPYHMHEKYEYFAKIVAEEFCDRVLPEGYARLTHYTSDASEKQK